MAIRVIRVIRVIRIIRVFRVIKVIQSGYFIVFRCTCIVFLDFRVVIVTKVVSRSF